MLKTSLRPAISAQQSVNDGANLEVNRSENQGELTLRRWFLRFLRIPLLLITVIAALTLLGYGLFKWVAWPALERLQPQIEQMASKIVGAPVAIGAIEPGFNGLHPVVVLSRIATADGQIQIQQAQVELSLRALATGQLKLRRLALDGVAIDARIAPNGHWHLAGLQFDPLSNTDMDAATRKKIANALQWALEQNSLSLQELSLKLTDERPQRNQAIKVSRVQIATLALENIGRRHRLNLVTDQFGEFQSEWRHPARIPAGDWTQWYGGSNWTSTKLVSGGLLSYLVSGAGFLKPQSQLYLHLNAATLRGSASLKFSKGRIDEAGIDNVEAQAKSLLSAVENATVTIKQVGTAKESRYSIDVSNLALQGLGALNGLRLATNKASSLVLNANGEIEKTSLHLGPLDLNAARSAVIYWANHQSVLDLKKVAGQLGLESWHIRGQIRKSQLRWDAAEDTLSGEIDAQALSLVDASNADQRPGFENIAGKIKFVKPAKSRDFEGSIELSGAQSKLYIPGALKSPSLPLDNLQGSARWSWFRNVQTNPNEAFRVKLERLTFSNRDAAGQASGTYAASRLPSQPGVIDLTATLSRLTGIRAAAYMPLRIVEPVRMWVDRAIKAGRASDVVIKLKGDLWHFPFRDASKGDFSIHAQLHDAELDYSPYWPAIKKIEGELIFDRASVLMKGKRGDINGVTVTNVKAEIPDLRLGMVKIQGQGDGNAQDMLSFVNQSPLKRFLSDNPSETVRTFMQSMTIDGPAKLDLQLQLPIFNLANTQVKGSVQMAAVRVVSTNLPAFNEVSGSLAFTESGIALQGIDASFDGGAIKVDGQSGAGKPIELDVRGTISAPALRAMGLLQPYRALLGFLEGSAAFKTRMIHSDDKQAFSVESDLVGMNIRLPLPLGKTAEMAWPFTFAVDDQAVQAIALASGGQPLFKVALKKIDSLKPTEQWVGGISVERAASDNVATGRTEKSPPPTSERGLRVHMDTPLVNVPDWQRWWQAYAPEHVVPKSTSHLASNSLVKVPVNQFGDFRVTDLTVLSDRVMVGNTIANDVVLGASEVDDVLTASAITSLANGSVSWSTNQNSLQVAMAKLDLAALGSETTATNKPVPPRNNSESNLQAVRTFLKMTPAVSVHVQQLTHNSRPWGELTIAAQAAPVIGATDLAIKKIILKHPLGLIQGEGRWTADTDSSQINFAASSPDAGKLLTEFGQANVVKNGAAVLSGELRWAGTPLEFDYASMRGEMHLAVEKGQFLKSDPGAAKLLSILNMQALARRLSFDFRDVFEGGFAFDSVLGDIKLSSGIATTDQIQVKGPLAEVNLSGAVNLEKETQTLNVRVMPEVNAGGASLAYAALANPAIGIGTFLAQVVLRKPLQELFSSEYEVTGTIDAPKVVNKRNSGHAADRLIHKPVKIEAIGEITQ